MRQAFPLTLLSEILDESMTQREVLTEARAGLIPALRELRLELVHVHGQAVVERDDRLYVATTIDVYGGCQVCGRSVEGCRRTLCGNRRCESEASTARSAAWRGVSESDAPRREGEWRKVADRRARVAALTRQGLSARQIALRVLGTDSPSARRVVHRDRAALRARAAA